MTSTPRVSTLGPGQLGGLPLRDVRAADSGAGGEVMEREFSAEAVRNLTFTKPPIGKRGYDEQEVDAFLQAIAAALEGRSPLSATDVHNAAFKKPPIGKRGYDEEEVDAFLVVIEDQLKARERSAGTATETSTKTATALAEAPDATNDPSDAVAA